VTVYTLDPLRDPRWNALVQRHSRASVFHTTAWLGALRRTYGYDPVAFTTSPPSADLQNGIVFCDVRSWLTGHRLVSLPFSDHCEPLVDCGQQLQEIWTFVQGERRVQGWKYIELRPREMMADGSLRGGESDGFLFHELDLRPGADALFSAFHRDSVQRKIRRAHREGLTYEDGVSDTLLERFYHLLVMTRHRHQLPPQPRSWFRQLAAQFGSAMKVRVASQADRAIAAIVTLRHRDTMVYKYGASDTRFHPLGGMHLLFWETIREACATGCRALDLGRSDPDNEGLATFKDRWGATRSTLTYCREPAVERGSSALSGYARQGLSFLPHGCRAVAGRLLYRHAG
jgi:hypothetical protein